MTTGTNAEEGPGMQILLLDDDPFVLRLLQIQLRSFSLRKRGFSQLVGCESGEEAVRLLEEGASTYGLIFCDLQMPGMDGVEFVRHLVRLGYDGALVLMSGEDERILMAAQQLARAHGLQVLGALRKPMFPETLRSVLDSMLSDSQPPVGEESEPVVYTPGELRRAIGAGELVNHYQPKIDMQTGEVRGMEALVRWQHPQDGLVPPAGFVPMAEKSGLIGDLGRTVLAQALRDAAAWNAAGHALHVAVNVSLDNLVEIDFPDTLARMAADAGLPLDKLVLEITESRLQDNAALQLDVLTRLRLKQVGLSIDDFGAGHSSFTHLRDLPFAEVKIDRGFVHGAASDASLQAIVDTSLDLARQLRLGSVAEGVEDREDWEYLRRAGCEMGQGYLIARPMPASEVESWLKSWPARRAELVG